MIIKSSKWEKKNKKSFQEKHQGLRTSIEAGNQKGYDFNDFSQDLYSSMYNLAPKMNEEIPSGHKWAKDALNIMKEMPEYTNMRKTTCGHSFETGLATYALTDYFANSFEVKKEENPEEVKKQMKQAEKNGASQEEMEKLQAQLTASEEEWGKEPSANEIRIAARKAFEAAKEDINESKELCQAFSFGTETGSDNNTSDTEKLELANKLRANKNLKKIAMLAGKFQREAQDKQTKKPTAGPDEITDIETGNDIGRLLPSELMKFADEDLEWVIAKDFLERSCLQYYLEENIPESSGPIVCCVDVSGSMQGEFDVWANSICLAMLKLAVSQKRDCHIIKFDTQVKYSKTFSWNNVDSVELIKAITYFTGGGTNFTAPMSKALKVIRESAAMKNADIIFVTDGYAELDVEKTIAEKTELKTEIYTVCLGTSCEVLKKVSDKYYELADLTQDQEVKDGIFSL
jgi:uncharacterized protein with von Willebrand factor type A (vWA) domain